MDRTAEITLEDKTALVAGVPPEVTVHPGDDCVIGCQRATEFGRIVRLLTGDDAALSKGAASTVLRQATLQDQSRAKENSVLCRMAVKTVAKRIEERKLPMRVVLARYTFDRLALHVTYAAEERVDCAELARAAGSELHTRVELRQIGVRDAARLAGGVGTCGRTLCCRSWIKEFDGVSVKMAKAQRMALNPGAIGGMCGRLKCCLRYEFGMYKELGEGLPKDGAAVRCPHGQGVLADKDILGRKVTVRMPDGRCVNFPADAVCAVVREETGQQESEDAK